MDRLKLQESTCPISLASAGTPLCTWVLGSLLGVLFIRVPYFIGDPERDPILENCSSIYCLGRAVQGLMHIAFSANSAGDLLSL